MSPHVHLPFDLCHSLERSTGLDNFSANMSSVWSSVDCVEMKKRRPQEQLQALKALVQIQAELRQRLAVFAGDHLKQANDTNKCNLQGTTRTSAG